LFLTPDLDAASFTGRVEVDIDIHEPVSTLTLHSLDLVLSEATVTANGTTFVSDQPEHDET
jgi:aminopeptidase N